VSNLEQFFFETIESANENKLSLLPLKNYCLKSKIIEL